MATPRLPPVKPPNDTMNQRMPDDDAMPREGNADLVKWTDRIRSALTDGVTVDVSEQVIADETTGEAGTAAETQRAIQPSRLEIPADALRKVLTALPLTSTPHGLRIRGAFIAGDLELTSIELDCPLHFEECDFEGDVDLSGSRIRELLMKGTRARSVALANAQIAGDLALFDGFAVAEGVHGAGVRVGGSVIVSGSKLTGGDNKAIVLDGAQIDGHFAAPDSTLSGVLSVAGATIGGHFDVSGAVVFNPNGHAVFLDGARVNRGLFGRRGFSAKGEVRTVGATIGGQIDFEAAYMSNPDGIALNLEGTHVSGAVLCRRVLIEGQARAIALDCHAISFSSAVLAQSAGREGALILDGARVGSDAFFDEVTATSSVRLPGACIGGQLVLLGARIYGNLVLQSAKVAHLFHSPTLLTGGSDLTRVTVDDLFTPNEGLPPGGLRAVGWAIGDIHGGMRTDWRLARQWLETVPPKSESVQSWNALAAVYDRNGDVSAARRLRLSAANRVTRRAPLATKVGRTAYLMLVGHGYYPRLAGLWLIVVVLAGSLLVSAHRESIVPTDATAAAAAIAPQQAAAEVENPKPEVSGETPCSELGGYPCLNPLTFTLTTLLPDVATSDGSDWKIRSEAVALTIGLAVMKLLAWFLSALVIASVTGLLRKT